MPSRAPVHNPPCNSLLWVVLLLSVFLSVKKFLFEKQIIDFTEKKFGLVIGLGIILFGLLIAWLRKRSDRVV